MDDWQPVAQDDWQPVTSKITLGDVGAQAWQDIKNIPSKLAGMVSSAATVPQRAFQESERARQGLDYNIAPVVEGAALGSPLPAAMRAGERAIPGVATAKVTEKPPIPTTEAIDQAQNQGFAAAKGMDVKVDPRVLPTIGTMLERQLREKGVYPEHAPVAYQTIERLKTVPEPSELGPAFTTITDLHNARQALGNAAGSRQFPKDKMAGSMGIELLDKYLADIPEKTVLAGPAAAASAELKNAIGNSAAVFRSEDIGARLTRAERQAAKSGSGSNIDNAIRQKISAILDSKYGTRGYTPEEIAQMERVVRGSPAANFARKVGKLGFNDGLTLLAHAAAALPSGGMSIPVGIAGTASRKIAEALTQRGANRIDEMVRARSPLAKSMQPTVRGLTGAEQARRAAVIRALMASQAQ